MKRQQLFSFGLLLRLLFLSRGTSSLTSSLQLTLRGDGDGIPTCGCDCCSVVLRRDPDKVENEDFPDDHNAPKCSLAPNCVSNDACDPKKDVFQVVRGGEADGISYEKFCLFECKPVNFVV